MAAGGYKELMIGINSAPDFLGDLMSNKKKFGIYESVADSKLSAELKTEMFSNSDCAFKY
jgi:hypothetical protein